VTYSGGAKRALPSPPLNSFEFEKIRKIINKGVGGGGVWKKSEKSATYFSKFHAF